MAINKKWRSSIQDTRVKRSADVGSDHHLAVAVAGRRMPLKAHSVINAQDFVRKDSAATR